MPSYSSSGLQTVCFLREDAVKELEISSQGGLLKVIMISGRTLAQGAGCEAKMTSAFASEVSTCSLSDEDWKGLGLSPDSRVRLTTQDGTVVARAKSDDGLPKGLVFMPMGPYANTLVGGDTGGCGMPHFKGVVVEIEPTDEQVQGIRELFADIRRKG
jgi:formylmethanofuran dehydrogenase subunit D